MGWRYDLENKTPQQRAIIMQRDAEEKSRTEEAKKKAAMQSEKPRNEKIFPVSLFMKLTTGNSGNFNGIETIRIYNDFCGEHQFVWFSTSILANGISRKKQNQFLEAIRTGFLIEMFFAIGKKGGGNNDIMFNASVVDIQSDKEEIPSPDSSLTPEVWRNENRKIWIKMKDIQPFQAISAKDLFIESTGRNLNEVLEKSQYSFGYVVRK